MNYVNEDILSLERISISNMLQEIGAEEVRKEILEGLVQKDKYISSKFFYNKRGSELYNAITRLPEYYPTRTEKSILEAIAPDLVSRHRDYDIMELGPGDASKISILFRALRQENGNWLRYLPFDISQSALKNIAEGLVQEFPQLEVEGFALDFISQFVALKRPQPLLICFLGSTIGNLEYAEATKLLSGISHQMKAGDTLLLGTDLIKAEEILHAAYNDAAGVTAEFNLNILNSVNGLLESDFDPRDFQHLAFFNPDPGRIEMHLVAKRDLLVRSAYLEAPLALEKGEHIHTENSHKYSESKIREMARSAGLDLVKSHRDKRQWFALTEFRK